LAIAANAYRITELNYFGAKFKNGPTCRHLSLARSSPPQTNYWQTFWNPTSGSTPKSWTPSRRKVQSIVHHHENVVKSTQHHRLAPGALPQDVLDEIQNHTLSVARKRNMVSFCQLRLGPLPSGSLPPVRPQDTAIHTNHAHSPPIQCQLARTLRIFAAANSLQLLGERFNHS